MIINQSTMTSQTLKDVGEPSSDDDDDNDDDDDDNDDDDDDDDDNILSNARRHSHAVGKPADTRIRQRAIPPGNY